MEVADINGKIALWEKLKSDDKKRGKIEGMSSYNSKLTLEFLSDLEGGKNIGSQKGRRSPSTLTKHRHNLIFFDKNFKKDLDKITKDELHDLFNSMMDGKLLRPDGKKYLGTGEFMKNFKVFWRWLMREGYVKKDITADLSRAEGNGKGRKPAWVYLGQENMKKLIDAARGDYRALILFLYDSGIRPSELYRLRVFDLHNNCTELHIPETRENGERVSKTFERTIKLKQCSQLIQQYIKDQQLQPNDYLVKVGQAGFNKYLRTLAKNIFGDTPTKARQSPDKMRMYDIRHNSAIFYLERYQRNVDLMYRFGWKREDKVFYYSEFIGKRDTISDDDMVTAEDKTKLQNQLEAMKKISDIQSEMNQLIIKQLGGGKATKQDAQKLADLANELKRMQGKPGNISVVEN